MKSYEVIYDTLFEIEYDARDAEIAVEIIELCFAAATIEQAVEQKRQFDDTERKFIVRLVDIDPMVDYERAMKRIEGDMSVLKSFSLGKEITCKEVEVKVEA